MEGCWLEIGMGDSVDERYLRGCIITFRWMMRRSDEFVIDFRFSAHIRVPR